MIKHEIDLRSLVECLERTYCLEREEICSIFENVISKVIFRKGVLTSDMRVEINRLNMDVHVYDTIVATDELKGIGLMSLKNARIHAVEKTRCISEGDVVEIEIPMSSLGRACARDIKLMFIQEMKKAKTSGIAKKYSGRIGEILTGTVSGLEKGDLLVTVTHEKSQIEVVLPRSERIEGERWHIGDKISGIVKKINEKRRISPIVISRSDDSYLEALLRKEIPEIDNGKIEITKIARDPGRRAKIMVRSKESKIDPVGVCIGKGGSHVKTLINELCGEKIDVLKHSNDLLEMTKDAFSPVHVDDVVICDDEKDTKIEVYVHSDDYYAALGKNGSNVKLVSKLLGEKIELKKTLDSLSFEERIEFYISNLIDILEISKQTAEKLVHYGFLNVETIANEDVKSFISSTGLDEIEGHGIHAAAVEITKSSLDLLS